jgi:hypothetical protein
MAKKTQRAGDHPVTPDGRYFVVNGRLWRMSNPLLPLDERVRLVCALIKGATPSGRGTRRIGDQATEDMLMNPLIALNERWASTARSGGKTALKTITVAP